MTSACWRPPDKKKAPCGGDRGAFQTQQTNRHYTTRLPAYGRELLQLREAGQVPSGVCLVAVGCWIQDQVPAGNLIVIPDDIELAHLSLRVLAGIPACLVHDDKHLARACDTVNHVLIVQPSWLAVANIESRVAATVLENGATGNWPWREWEWQVFDGGQALELPCALVEAA